MVVLTSFQSVEHYRLPIFSGVVLFLSVWHLSYCATNANEQVLSGEGTYLKNLEHPVKASHLLCSGVWVIEIKAMEKAGVVTLLLMASHLDSSAEHIQATFFKAGTTNSDQCDYVTKTATHVSLSRSQLTIDNFFCQHAIPTYDNPFSLLRMGICAFLEAALRIFPFVW
jgi:hypothetical protein